MALQAQQSKYTRVADDLRAQIAEGELAGGTRLPSVVALKAIYGVSNVTLQRALEELEREQLIVREHGRGMFVRQPAATARTGVLGVFGLRPDDARVAYWGRILASIRRAAAEAGYDLLISEDEGRLHEARVDGAICLGPHRARAQQPAALPGVAIETTWRDWPMVWADHWGGMETAMSHLQELGHRRIGHFTWLGDRSLDQRQAAWARALRVAGSAGFERWQRLPRAAGLAGRTLVEAGYRAMAAWLADDWAELALTALVVQNAELAIGALDALGEAGISVPADLSLVAFDGLEAARFCRPRLTCVETDYDGLGAQAVELILRQHECKVPLVGQVVCTQLQLGASTAPPKEPC